MSKNLVFPTFNNSSIVFKEYKKLLGENSEKWIKGFIRKNKKSIYGELVDKFVFVSGCWDNYDCLISEENGGSIINRISKFFYEDENCKKMHPLGDFKDYNGLSDSDVYDKYMERLESTFANINGRDCSLLDFIVLCIRKMKKFLHYDAVKFKNSEEVVSILGALFFRTIPGIKNELMVLNELNRKNVYGEYYFYLAPDDFESFDVDIIGENKEGNKVYFSIKHGRAFDNNSLYKFRFVKGKMKPDFYLDFKNKVLNIKAPNNSSGSFNIFEVDEFFNFLNRKNGSSDVFKRLNVL